MPPLPAGLSELRIVGPACDYLSDDARARASGAAGPVLERARLYDSVAEAVADIQDVYCCTVRLRDMTQIVCTAEEMASRVVGRHSQSAGHRSAIVFGPERSGLTNEDLGCANAIIQIATSGCYSLQPLLSLPAPGFCFGSQFCAPTLQTLTSQA